MNTANIFLLITFLLVTLSSCTQEKEDNMDGIQKDTILQSVKDTCIDYRQQKEKIGTSQQLKPQIQISNIIPIIKSKRVFLLLLKENGLKLSEKKRMNLKLYYLKINQMHPER